MFVLTEHPTASVDSEILAAIDDLAAKLERADASVSRRSELLPSPAESQSLVEKFTEAARAIVQPAGAPPAKATIKDWFDCLRAQEAIRRQWDAFFEAFDVVVAPCYATPPSPLQRAGPWPG